MIYDCFTFFNELDLLEIRLNVLADAVDKFVLVEMTKTHQGRPKPLYYHENKERFKKFHSKIIHIAVNSCPVLENSWAYENYQRNGIARGLNQCACDDVIMISDVDEIPNPQKILTHLPSKGVSVFLQNFFYYYLNWQCQNEKIWKWGTKIMRYSFFLNGLDAFTFPPSVYLVEALNSKTTPNKIRLYPQAVPISDGGWHFSYLGGVQQIVLKIQSFSHQEFNRPEYLDVQELENIIARGGDILKRPKYHFKAVKIDQTFPFYIRRNQDKFAHLIRPCIPWWKQVLFKHA